MKYIWIANDSKVAIEVTQLTFDECVNAFNCMNSNMVFGRRTAGQAFIVYTLIRVNSDKPWSFRYRYSVAVVK